MVGLPRRAERLTTRDGQTGLMTFSRRGKAPRKERGHSATNEYTGPTTERNGRGRQASQVWVVRPVGMLYAYEERLLERISIAPPEVTEVGGSCRTVC